MKRLFLFFIILNINLFTLAMEPIVSQESREESETLFDDYFLKNLAFDSLLNANKIILEDSSDSLDDSIIINARNKDNEFLGRIIFNRLKSKPEIGWIDIFEVTQQHRGKGVGLVLFTECIDRLHRMGCKQIWWDAVAYDKKNHMILANLTHIYSRIIRKMDIPGLSFQYSFTDLHLTSVSKEIPHMGMELKLIPSSCLRKNSM